MTSTSDTPAYVWAITFDQDVFGLFATEELAEAELERQIEAGGPAWDDCKVERWKVIGGDAT